MSTALSTGRTGGEPGVSESDEPGVSESAATKRRAGRERERRTEAARRAQARAPPEGRTKSLCRRRKPPPETEGGEPGVSESAATKRRAGKT